MFIVDEPESTLPTGPSFKDLDLIPPLHEALEQAGYETPTPIQAATIPHLLAGRDVLGQAQTGTGKTAAFALPLLSRINLDDTSTQVLVLAPTRELAIQVADSFKRYAKNMKGLRVSPIYGGQAYSVQINQLSRGLHVVVGTPGRVMDHMRQGALKIDALRCLVLDEADEMLRMGFVDDVQWILSHTPAERQIALFSATMPAPIRKIADEHLKNPEIVSIDAKQRTAETIRQRYVVLPHRSKFDALTRILEAEQVDGVIVFAKTKIGTVELAEGLQESGFSAVALNGDIPQAQRERSIEQLKSGAINIIVATDVAARGLDVQRISHVVNYDLPFDTEAYVHRIGRTGRAGRSGEAILFVAPSQRGFLRVIERGTSQTLEPMTVPDAKSMNAMRIKRFKDGLADSLAKAPPTFFLDLLSEFQQESGADPLAMAAVFASKYYGERPFLIQDSLDSRRDDRQDRRRDDDRSDGRSSGRRRDREGYSESVSERSTRSAGREGSRRRAGEFETFRVEVGANHGVKAGNIVGAIANEAGLSSREIINIRILDEYSTVDLPAGMPRAVFKTLGQAWVVGRQLRISKLSDHAEQRSFEPRTEAGRATQRVSAGKSLREKPRKAKVKGEKKPKVRSPEEQSIFEEAARLIENA